MTILTLFYTTVERRRLFSLKNTGQLQAFENAVGMEIHVHGRNGLRDLVWNLSRLHNNNTQKT
jgi:hypothetical protein